MLYMYLALKLLNLVLFYFLQPQCVVSCLFNLFDELFLFFGEVLDTSLHLFFVLFGFVVLLLHNSLWTEGSDLFILIHQGYARKTDL